MINLYKRKMLQETRVRIRFFSTAALAAVASLGLMFPLAGCGLTDTQAWKSSRRFYYSHINTPAKLDLEDPARLSSADSRLATRLMAVDEQLTGLERALEALGTTPDQAAVDGLLRRFPWLSGLTLTDATGSVLAAAPAISLKQLDFSPLLEPAPATSPRALRASVQDTPLGPEVLLARPFLAGSELRSLLVASFDFRSLLPYVSAPGDLVVRSPEVLVWSGDVYYDDTPLAGVNWTETLAKRSHGTLRAASGTTGTFVWLARYLGEVPLVFATPAA